MNKKLLLLLLLLLIPITSAIDSNYNIIVEENGNCLVIIEFNGKGLVNLPLQEDVNNVKIKGALYTLNNKSIDISIGSTGKAVALYKTSMLTSKQKGTWSFKIGLIETDNKKVNIAIPKNARIIETTPPATIEALNYTKLIWDTDIKNIEIKYSFPETETVSLEDEKEPKSLIIISIITAIITLLVVILIINKKSNKQNIIKTLSKNESIIVNILIKHKGEIKRNKLEKISKLAKSSLANTLNNLEKKNIIKIDKTYTTHFIKFTRWFNGL